MNYTTYKIRLQYDMSNTCNTYLIETFGYIL